MNGSAIATNLDNSMAQICPFSVFSFQFSKISLNSSQAKSTRDLLKQTIVRKFSIK